MKATPVAARRASQHEGMQMDGDGPAVPGPGLTKMDDHSLPMPEHDGMSMDHGGMEPMMGGCGMCMELMGTSG